MRFCSDAAQPLAPATGIASPWAEPDGCRVQSNRGISKSELSKESAIRVRLRLRQQMDSAGIFLVNCQKAEDSLDILDLR